MNAKVLMHAAFIFTLLVINTINSIFKFTIHKTRT